MPRTAHFLIDGRLVAGTNPHRAVAWLAAHGEASQLKLRAVARCERIQLDVLVAAGALERVPVTPCRWLYAATDKGRAMVANAVPPSQARQERRRRRDDEECTPRYREACAMRRREVDERREKRMELLRRAAEGRRRRKGTDDLAAWLAHWQAHLSRWHVSTAEHYAAAHKPRGTASGRPLGYSERQAQQGAA